MIEDKLKLYSNTYVKGECRSKEYEAQIKQEKALNTKLDLADMIFNELNFQFNRTQKDQVKELILTHKNFNKLHRKASNETIILSFIYYIKMNDNPIRLDKQKRIIYKITKLNLNTFRNIFELIICRLQYYHMQNTRIMPRQPTNIDHNLLYKGKLRK